MVYNIMRELNVNDIEQVHGGMTVGEGIAAVGGVIGIAAAAPIIGTVATIAGLGGMIGIAVMDIVDTLTK